LEEQGVRVHILLLFEQYFIRITDTKCDTHSTLIDIMAWFISGCIMAAVIQGQT